MSAFAASVSRFRRTNDEVVVDGTHAGGAFGSHAHGLLLQCRIDDSPKLHVAVLHDHVDQRRLAPGLCVKLGEHLFPDLRIVDGARRFGSFAQAGQRLQKVGTADDPDNMAGMGQAPHHADAILATFPAEAKPHRPPGSVSLVLPAGVPVEAARAFVKRRFSQGDVRVLHYYRGGFYVWCSTHYKQLGEEQFIRAQLYHFLEKARVQDEHGDFVPYNPTPHKVSAVCDALRAGVYVNFELDPPFWLPPPKQVVLPSLELTKAIAFRNGLLNIETRDLIAHSPYCFNTSSIPFNYDPEAPTPKRWNQFLSELFADDKQSRQTLMEIFGLLLTTDTSFQKIFLLKGPKRSGKGTIGYVLTALLGRENVANPTMAMLSTNFGLAPLIDKRLALISDARLERRSSQAVEHLLSISGEDRLSIDRKYQEHWTGKLGARIVILVNELPGFYDASGALASRMIPLMLTQSFLGKEQLDLKDELQGELPGILNQALLGLDRLRRRGHFVIPDSSLEAVRQLEELTSPVTAFVRDRCRIRVGGRVEKATLFAEWKEWCAQQGIVKPGAQTVFGARLLAAFPTVKSKHSDAVSYYEGIELLSEDGVYGEDCVYGEDG